MTVFGDYADRSFIWGRAGDMWQALQQRPRGACVDRRSIKVHLGRFGQHWVALDYAVDWSRMDARDRAFLESLIDAMVHPPREVTETTLAPDQPARLALPEGEEGDVR